MGKLKLMNYVEIIGYICYKDNKQVIEAIYATLPSTEIYNKFKYRSDKFGNSSKKIRDNYFKARSLAFQYFINLLLIEGFFLFEKL